MKYCAFLSFLLIGIIFSLHQIDAKLEEKFSWKVAKFDWPSAEAEQQAIDNGSYVAANNLPLGLERWQNKLFVTVPRWMSGTAAALTYIDLNTAEKSPALKPYPSWKANTLPAEGAQLDADSIISPFRVKVDSCDRLWVMDTGKDNIIFNPRQISNNSILIFDLKTDTLLRRFTIPDDQIKSNTFLANIVVDLEPGQCDNAYAYISDISSYAVIVYSLKEDRSYRVTNTYFENDPAHGNFNVSGVTFKIVDGVFGIAVGPKLSDQSRDVYFHPFGGVNEFKVNNRVLQNETLVTSAAADNDFHLIGSRANRSESNVEVYNDKTNVMFYNLPNRDSIGCWNLESPYNVDTQGVVEQNSETLNFPNDLKIDREDNLWVLSDKMPAFLYVGLDNNVTNFRILTGKTTELIKGTPCEKEENKTPPPPGAPGPRPDTCGPRLGPPGPRPGFFGPIPGAPGFFGPITPGFGPRPPFGFPHFRP